MANHERALLHAKEGDVDLVVHGGDVFHRSRVPTSLVFQAFRPLIEVAESGVPVFVVPGNHERSRIPHRRFATHPKLHIFERPETAIVETGRGRVAVSGFPYHRHGIRQRFPEMLEETGWRTEKADLRLLCLHHCVEGAKVGPADYTFRRAPDVIRCSDLPADFAAVLSGHIHRHQLLWQDLQGHVLPTPVLYPGSVERTAFAEVDEEKGFMILEVMPGRRGGTLVRHDFVHLPTRPMLLLDLQPSDGPRTPWRSQDLQAQLNATLRRAPRDAVLRLRVHGRVSPDVRTEITAARLRRLAPPEMNLEIMLSEDQGRRGGQKSVSPNRVTPNGPQGRAPCGTP